MAERLNAGDTFPKLTLTLTDGSALELPGGIDAKYRIILFYRGHW
jgi:peroxiredoxin